MTTGDIWVDLVERAGQLKTMLADFAMSPRFDRELSAVIRRNFPDGVVTNKTLFSLILDHFALQHRLPSGDTVVEAFVAAHPQLTDAEHDMLQGWRDVVEGVFEIRDKDHDALVLFNLFDGLTYRTRSNRAGRQTFKPLNERMIVFGRVVRAGDDWLVSGTPAAASLAPDRDQTLTLTAEQAMRNPQAVFREHDLLVKLDVRLYFDGELLAGIVLDDVQDTYPWYQGTIIDGPALAQCRELVDAYHDVDLEFDYCPHHPQEGPYEDTELAEYAGALTALHRTDQAADADPDDDAWLGPWRNAHPEQLERYLRFLDFRRWQAVTSSGENVGGIPVPPSLDLVTRRFAFRA